MAEKTAYIGLGSNLGDRKNYIDKALKMLAGSENIQVTRTSNLIETAPLGGTDQPEYLNAVAELKTTLRVEDLHKALVDIETSLGRIRREKWSPRTIDLDLLLFGSDIVNSPDLTIPHPQIHLRSFVLKGLCRLNPDLLHPVIKEPVKELADRLSGLDFAPNPDLPQLVSVAGIIGVGKTTLAKGLTDCLDCDVLLEPYDTNPFLPEVYAGKKELALDSQLYFLTSRAKQLDRKVLAGGQIYISDYVFDKELIYARCLLNDQQLALYEEIYPPFAAKVAAPVLVIYMQDSAENCLSRIRSRNRPYEQQIKLPFLEGLSSDYERLFKHWKTCPVIRVSTSEAADIEHLANQVKCYIARDSVIVNTPKQSKI